jgi:hypothetical protein
MSKTIDLLTITDSVCGVRSGASCSQGDVAQIARLLYGASASSIRVAKSQDDLVHILQEYTSIRRLVFMLEGSEGQIAVNHFYRALSWHADALQKRAPTVQEIVFDNCNVIKSASEVVTFMKALHASRARGASSFHIWAKVGVATKPDGTTEDLEAALRKNFPLWDNLRDYLIPGQPTLQQLASGPGLRTIYLEFFSRDPLAITRLENLRSISQLHGVSTRSKLTSKTYNVTAAKAAEGELDVPAGPISLVTYVDPAAGRESTTPIVPSSASTLPAPTRLHIH